MKNKLFLFLMFCLCSVTLLGGGYQVRLQGHKQTGIGLIGTPFAFDASSIFYNPGSLALYDGKYSISVGASGIISNHIFQKEATNYQARTENPLGTPFFGYFSIKIKDKIAVGIGVYTPFGSSAKWNEDWAGRYLIRDVKISAIYIQPTVAYQYKGKFGIGAGFVYAIGNVELNKALPYSETSKANLKGKATNFGFNAGVFYKPIEKLSIGIDYRSQIMMKLEGGDATFTVPSALSTSVPATNKFNAELPLPANLDFGLAYQINDKFLLAAEVNWVMWNTYKSLDFEFEQSGDLLNTQNPREYKNSWITRLGGQYKLNDIFTFRAGVYYDPSPANEKYFTPETVTLNTIAFTLGATITPVKGLEIDLSYLELHGLQADKTYEPDNFGGTYKTMTFIPGIGLSYRF
ncbi:MAG: outer membrane protein transport protein [Bacteroidales bacterium]|nr:outer membrane protein transport protein [Bacteroidales bacterium]